MDIEGRGNPERIATLETSSCDVLLVDDEAIYVGSSGHDLFVGRRNARRAPSPLDSGKRLR